MSPRSFACAITISILTCGSGSPALAFSLPTRQASFNVLTKQKNVLEAFRTYAGRRDLKFKFPFVYKNAVLITDDAVNGVNRVEFCVEEREGVDGFTVRLLLVGGGTILAPSLDTFDLSQYTEKFVHAVVSNPVIKKVEIPNADRHFTGVCEELRGIAWPGRIYSR